MILILKDAEVRFDSFRKEVVALSAGRKRIPTEWSKPRESIHFP